MKKKFKRSVEKTTAKIKQRRIMSALLAFSMFVSNGISGNLPKVRFTAVAEGLEDDSIDIAPEFPEPDYGGEEQAEENDPETPDDSGQTDGEQENEESNDAESDSEQPDVEEESTDEDIEIVAEDVAMLAEDDAQTGQNTPIGDCLVQEVTIGSGDKAVKYPVIIQKVDPIIKVQPEINNFDNLKPWHMDFSTWETNKTYKSDNPYILRCGSGSNDTVTIDTVTVYGVTGNFEFVSKGAADSKEVKDEYGNTYYIKTDASLWLADEANGAGGTLKDNDDNDILSPDGDISYKIGFEPAYEKQNKKDKDGKDVIDEEGNPVQEDVQIGVKPTLRVYMTYKGSEKVTEDNMAHGRVVFNNGIEYEKDKEKDYTSWQEFYIGVRPKKSFIEVYTKVTDRDMNEVNEYVYDANLSTEQKLNVNGEFVVNSEVTPYMLHDGESVYIRGIGRNGNISKDNVTKDKKDENDNVVTDEDGNVMKTDEVKTIGIHIYGGENKGWYDSHTCDIDYAATLIDRLDNIYTKYTVHGKAGKFYIEYDTGYKDLDGKPVYEKFYFQIYDQTNWRGNYYDHADIEIADNGIYTMTREAFEYDENGDIKKDENGTPIKYKYVTTYEAFVSNVNRSEILDEEGNPIMLQDQYYDENKPDKTLIVGGNYVENAQSTKYDKPRRMDYIPASDYWKDPSKKPGDTQFEMTSKYERDVEIKNGKVTKNELIYPSIADNLRIPMNEVVTVNFYVDLLLRPQTIQKCDMNGEAIGDVVPISNQPEQTIHNVVFNMDHQSVLDAYNKCPDHSGLDFTVKENLNDVISASLYYTELDLEAEKVFGHNELNTEKFDFELWYIPRDDYDYNPKDENTFDYFKDAEGKYVLDDKGNKIKKAQEHLLYNVQNGTSENNVAKIIFKDIPFFESVVSYTSDENTAKAYTYHYQIREKIPKKYKPNVTYDKSVIDVYVELTKDTTDSNTLITTITYEWYDATAESRVRKIVTANKVKNTDDGISDSEKLKLTTIGETTFIYKKLDGVDDEKNEIWSNYDNDVTPQFVNKYKVYNLPSAGGSGVYIYIISGLGLMLSAAVMYRRKRKEE